MPSSPSPLFPLAHYTIVPLPAPLPRSPSTADNLQPLIRGQRARGNRHCRPLTHTSSATLSRARHTHTQHAATHCTPPGGLPGQMQQITPFSGVFFHGPRYTQSPTTVHGGRCPEGGGVPGARPGGTCAIHWGKPWLPGDTYFSVPFQYHFKYVCPAKMYPLGGGEGDQRGPAKTGVIIGVIGFGSQVDELGIIRGSRGSVVKGVIASAGFGREG